jgi:hypothetical protein
MLAKVSPDRDAVGADRATPCSLIIVKFCTAAAKSLSSFDLSAATSRLPRTNPWLIPNPYVYFPRWKSADSQVLQMQEADATRRFGHNLTSESRGRGNFLFESAVTY